MEPAVRVELTTNGLQIRCSATELRWQTFSLERILLKTKGALCEYSQESQHPPARISRFYEFRRPRSSKGAFNSPLLHLISGVWKSDSH